MPVHRDQFAALTACMERCEARLDAIETSLADFRTEVRGRFEAIERRLAGRQHRLAGKASTVMVGMLTGVLIAVMTVYKFW